MRALFAIDIQNTIVDRKDFKTELENIEEIIQSFEQKNEPVIFIKNIAGDQASPFYEKKKVQKYTLL